MEKDVVCGMQVDPTKAARTSQHDGRTYYFCSQSCNQVRRESRPTRQIARFRAVFPADLAGNAAATDLHVMDWDHLRYRDGGHEMTRHSHSQAAFASAEVLDPVCG